MKAEKEQSLPAYYKAHVGRLCHSKENKKIFALITEYKRAKERHYYVYYLLETGELHEGECDNIHHVVDFPALL